MIFSAFFALRRVVCTLCDSFLKLKFFFTLHTIAPPSPTPSPPCPPLLRWGVALTNHPRGTGGCHTQKGRMANLVSDSANPHYVSDLLPQPVWDHRSTGQL